MTPAPFIVGVGRSGTTLLRLMLDAHPDLAIPPETRFIPLAAQSCATATDPAKSLVETPTSRVHWPDFHVDGAVLAERLAAIEPFSLSAALHTFHVLYAERFGKPPRAISMRK